MAHEEPISTDAQSQDVTMHVRDYARFLTMFKWGAIIALTIGLIILIILK